MKYTVKKPPDGYIVTMIWPDGYETEYGPFNTLDYANWFADGFINVIDCHY